MTTQRHAAGAATLALAAVIFLIGGFVGLRLLTASPEKAVATPTCKSSVVTAGSELDSNVVTINVFNASGRSGFANRALINLQANGFLGGQIGNSASATKPKRVAILTSDPDDPRVKLVAAQFKDEVDYAPADIQVEDGVIVVIGGDFGGLKSDPKTTITTDRDIAVCTPVVTLP